MQVLCHKGAGAAVVNGAQSAGVTQENIRQITFRAGMAGLAAAEAKRLQEQYGKNELTSQKKESFLRKVLHIICEPMFLLLIVAAIIYFILGEPRDGAIMLIFVVGIISIDVIQEWKTDKTLNALKDLSAPHVRCDICLVSGR